MLYSEGKSRKRHLRKEDFMEAAQNLSTEEVLGPKLPPFTPPPRSSKNNSYPQSVYPKIGNYFSSNSHADFIR